MDKKNILLVLQLLFSIILISVILIQSRGTGFARSTRSHTSFTRRGLEKLIYRLTFIVAFLFMLVSIMQILI